MAQFYDSLVIEIRPRLQSVNVYIVLKQKTSDVDVILNHNNFSVILEGNEHCIPCGELNILPDSLSSLQTNDTHLSFRFQTNALQDFSGRFKAEFLQPPQIEKYTRKNNWLKKTTVYTISCLNCTQIFCNNVTFQRVLPLPSDNLDLSNWFCHGHNADANTNLNPAATDVFYTETYVHLAYNLLENVRSSDVIVCKRCLVWIGLKVNDVVARLWFNTVCFKSDGETYNTAALSDVYIVTNEILNNSFLNAAKIVFHCQVTNNVRNYILLWVVEKKLNIIADVCKGITNCDVAKVLFKFETEETAQVLDWQNETITSVVGISKVMMVDLLKNLYCMNKFFPREFRTTNGFFVSYLCLYDKSFM